MPAATQYLFPSDGDDYRELESDFDKEIAERSKRFKKHWDFYDGIMPLPLKIGKDKVDDNVLLPKVGQVADKVVSFLIGEGVKFDAGGDGEESQADRDIKALWDINRGETLIHNMALTGTIAGHLFVRLEPREKDYPRIVNLNPSNCFAFWDVADVGRILWYRLQFQDGQNGAGKRIDYVCGAYQDGQFDHAVDDQWWEIVFTTKQGHVPVWEQQIDPQLWPYEWSPIIDWQNLPRPHGYYGLDDVKQVVRLNEALNFVASNYSRILKHHAFPKTVGLGFAAGDVTETEIGGFYTVPKSPGEANIYNLEMESDLASSKAFIDMLNMEIWQAARMIDPQTMKDRVGALTNFGLRVLFTDAIHKTETKRLLYGEALEVISQRALELARKKVPDTIVTKWSDALPEDEAAVVQSLQAELAAGIIDKQTYRELRGYKHEEILERLQEQGASEDNIGARLLAAFERGA